MGRTVEKGDLLRVGDGTGEARVESVDGEWIRVRYSSGARRTVLVENLARPGGRTQRERELLGVLAEAAGAGIVFPVGPRRVAALALVRSGHAVEDGRHLFLWSTRRNFREGLACSVARAWGFEPCGEVIWGLRSPGLGTPRALAADHEPILIAKRGSPEWTSKAPVGVHFWRQPYYPKGGGKIHSAKPDAFQDHVELWSPGPYLELFARRDRLGWDTWGNESLNTIRTPELVGGGVADDRG
jgi:N6-adenosine-specific RNA methylase IME4